MYSIVMMTALTAAPDGPEFNGYFRDLFSGNSCNGCNGCSGGVRYSCYGGGCSGSVAYPASCSGCCGSSCCGGHVFGLGIGDRVRSFFDRDTRSGCCGSHSYGCTGSSYSCSGYSCSGSSLSCSGSSYSCFGGPAISYTPMAAGGLSCQGGLIYPAPPAFDQFPPAPGAPGGPFAVPAPAPGATGLRPTPAAAPSATVASGSAARATVVVRLPADARLAADGRELALTGTERTFVSPELPKDQEFVYRFTAQYDRDGETVSVTKKVTVRAGATAAVEFADLTAARSVAPNTGKTTSTGSSAPAAPEPTKAEPPARDTPAPTGSASDRATITVKLPAGATLYVDDKKSPSKEPVRQFATPPLPANREFAYLLKAEIVRDGQPETLSQKVPFRAGERVTVDFTSLGSK